MSELAQGEIITRRFVIRYDVTQPFDPRSITTSHASLDDALEAVRALIVSQGDYATVQVSRRESPVSDDGETDL